MGAPRDPEGAPEFRAMGYFSEIGKIPVLPGISLDELYGASLHSIIASTQG
jgi:hypothetical protein